MVDCVIALCTCYVLTTMHCKCMIANSEEVTTVIIEIPVSLNMGQ